MSNPAALKRVLSSLQIIEDEQTATREDNKVEQGSSHEVLAPKGAYMKCSTSTEVTSKHPKKSSPSSPAADEGASTGSSPSELPLYREGRMAPQPGAHAVDGHEHQEIMMDESAYNGSEINPDELHLADVPTVLDASLAPSPRRRRDEEEAVIIEAVRDPETKRIDQVKRQWLVAGSIVIVAAMIGIVVGVMWNPKSSTSSPEPTLDPTGAPTTEEFLNSSLLSFLEKKATKGVPFKSDSFHAMAAQWILHDDPTQIKEMSVRLTQRFALALLYFQTTDGGQRPWRRCNPPTSGEDDICVENSGEMRWLTGSHECSWYGVGCGRNSEEEKEVFLLGLSVNNLFGPFPTAIFLLPELAIFDSIGNRLAGTVPEEVYDMTKLEYIQLYDNPSLSGTISTLIGQLTNLNTLSFEGCGVNGTVPTEIGRLSLMKVLGLGTSSLSGSIPEEIYNLTNLEGFAVESCFLTGTISTRIGLLTKLEQFYAYESAFSGSIPTEIGNCSPLIYFQSDSNNLSGPIPSEFGRLKIMENVIFSENPRMSGNLPPEIFHMTNLKFLSFYNTSQSGTIPTTVGLMSNLLKFLPLSNKLSGSIPTEIGLVSSINMLHFDKNELTGPIPSELGSLSGLTVLRIGWNKLSGSIPSEISDASNLNNLAFSYNPGLNGTIPQSLFGLEKLTTLDLDKMSLTGTIGTEFGIFHLIPGLWLNGNPLTGTMPTEIGRMSTLNTFDISLTLLDGHVSDEVCELPLLHSASADCLPLENPPVTCKCCNRCYNRYTLESLDMEAEG